MTAIVPVPDLGSSGALEACSYSIVAAATHSRYIETMFTAKGNLIGMRPPFCVSLSALSRTEFGTSQ